MMLLLLLLLLLLLVLVVLHMVVVGGVGADAVVAVSQLLPLSQLSLDFPKPYAALGKSALNAAVGEERKSSGWFRERRVCPSAW